MFRLQREGACLLLDSRTAAGGDPEPRPSRVTDLAPAPVAARLLSQVRQMLDEASPPQAFDYTEGDGDEARQLEVRLSRCGGDEVLVTVRDISATKAAAREAAAARRLAQTHGDVLLRMLEQLRLGALFVDRSGSCAMVNQTAETLCQQPASALVGRSLDEIDRFSPEDVAQLSAMMAKPTGARERVTVRGRDTDPQRGHWEVDVHDDPRDPDRRILLLHDLSELHELRRQLEGQGQFDDLVGASEPMRQLFRLIDDLAPVDTTVLIEGETGTGKELVARSLHQRSTRAAGPFVAVNCAGLTESLVTSQLFGHRRGAFTGAVRDQPGVFEAANGGVVFLDEIGDVSPVVQSTLLRTLQEKKVTRLGDTRPRAVDVRILAATHRRLEDEVEAGRFRADLLYRVRVARIRIPPLRERGADVPLLVKRFLAEFRAEFGKPIRGVSARAMRALMDYGWPGNVRELRGALEHAAIRSWRSVLETSDLPPEIAVAPPQTDRPGDQPDPIRDALRRTKGNRTKAARLLGVSRATLYRRLSALDLNSSD